MKKILLLVLILSCYSLNLLAQENKTFTSQNTWEIGCSFYGGVFFSEYDSRANISLHPEVNYYLINNFHLGIGLGIATQIINYKNEDFYNYYIGLTLSFYPGYTFHISDKIFFDISTGIYYNYSINNISPTYLSFPVRTIFKYDMGNTLIHLYITYGFIDYSSNEGWSKYYQLSCGLGFSLYF